MKTRQLVWTAMLATGAWRLWRAFADHQARQQRSAEVQRKKDLHTWEAEGGRMKDA